MITHLQIEGLAIIESLSIDFSAGFNVITGETGAGKSILIRALNFLTGGKANADTVRQGCSAASVTGQFWVPKGHRALAVLDALAIAFEDNDGGDILVRRQLTNKGRSQAWINDVPVTSLSLRQLGLTLVDVFAQHENQRLMDPNQHISYIDDFLENSDTRNRLDDLFRACQKRLIEIETMLEAYYLRSRSKDYFSFRLEELDKFSPSNQDFEKVAALSQGAESILSVREVISSAVQALEGNDDTPSSSAVMKEIARQLSQLGPESLGPLAHKGEELKSLALEICHSLDSLNYELSRFASEFDVDEKELEEAQQRMYGYQDLFRKHSVKDALGLMAETERLRFEMEFVENAEGELGDSLTQLRDLARDLKTTSDSLTKLRMKAAKAIKKAVESELHELAMPGAILSVEFNPVRRPPTELNLEFFGEEIKTLWQSSSEILTGVSERGAEKGQFLLASNPGEPSLPLNRVASGGELSRIMLALKKALVADAETCVLVFDEIDSGISGRVADVVGKKMRELANVFQVICISHLPQVAVYADTHFLVAKAGKAKRTETSIVRLSAEESAGEIARLLSGAEVSKVSLANAKSLIKRAQGSDRSQLQP
jgi:DNA repair protein RecN (Recombination protein N)